MDFSFAKSKENKGHQAVERVLGPTKDFFGRLVVEDTSVLQEIDGNSEMDKKKAKGKMGKEDNKVWVTYHEGYSNAVRKPLTVEELLRGL